MTPEWIAWCCLVVAAIPAGLASLNLLLYRSPRREAPIPGARRPRVSVLIPARNEEKTLSDAIASVMPNLGREDELLVLDDHSTDRTAAIVTELASRDPRLRLLQARDLPPDWCGKQHACHQLAREASGEWMLFLDADVRIAPDALPRILRFAVETGADLVSGVPRQRTGSFLERLLIPLIHFVLLGFLPMSRMRRSRSVSYAAGCGQLFLARRAAYIACGGHAAIRASLHDGLQLPRVFRRAGFRTDLFDATPVAECRMYHGSAETWRGLGKNASEGLAHPSRIVPFTGLLLLGQVLPAAVIGLAWIQGTSAGIVWFAAAACGWGTRAALALRFRQSWTGVILHPVSVLVLCAIQWTAFYRAWRGLPSDWKGRAYPAPGAATRPASPRPAGLAHGLPARRHSPARVAAGAE